MNRWGRLYKTTYLSMEKKKMATRYDSFADEIMKNESSYRNSLDILSLAKSNGLEVFVQEEYVVDKEMGFEICSPIRDSIHKVQAKKLFNLNMPYHLLLMTPSATEQREWIAYCTVLIYLHKTRHISDSLLMMHSIGNNTLRGDTFHRIAACLLIPHLKLNEWAGTQSNISSDFSEWDVESIQKAAIHFRVSASMIEERIHLYDNGVSFLLNPAGFESTERCKE